MTNARKEDGGPAGGDFLKIAGNCPPQENGSGFSPATGLLQ
jgi:hypothetical protein